MYRNAAEALDAHGYCPATTPIDTLIAGPVPMHLRVAEAMEDDGDYSDDDLDGFHDWDPEAEAADNDCYRIDVV